MKIEELRKLEALATPVAAAAAETSLIGDYGPPSGILFATVCQDDKKVAEFYEQPDAELYAAMRNALTALLEIAEAAQQFVDKCDNGQAHSKHSYAAFKTALAALVNKEKT